MKTFKGMLLLGMVLSMTTVLSAQMYTMAEVAYPNDEGEPYVYQDQLQEVQLSDVSIEVSPKGSYLQVTETALVRSVATIPTGTVRTYLKGKLTLPDKATITAFALQSDTTSFVARLQPEEPADTVIDVSRGDLMGSLKFITESVWGYDPVTYQYGSRSIPRLELTVESIEKSKEYTVILTYMVPTTGAPNAGYPLSVLTHSSSLKPGVFEFTYSADSTAPAYVLSVSSMNFQLKNGQSIQVPYQQNFMLFPKEVKASTMHLTDFNDGAWKGKYLLLNTTIPDSVMTSLSKPTEMMVLWRWNKPHSFVATSGYYDYNDVVYSSKYLTQYGYQAVEQSNAIRSLFQDVTASGSKVGLVHSVPEQKTEVFALCRAQSSQYLRIDTYLAQFDQQYLEKSKFFHDPNQTGNPGDKVPDDTSSKEFITSLKIIKGLYSDESGILRHLIILTCGPIAPSRNFITLEEVDSLFKNISLDCNNAAWTDVNMADFKLRTKKEDLINFGQFQIPQFRPSSLMLSVESESKSYSFPFSPDQSGFSIMAKSTGAWKRTLSWTGYNASGEIMSTVQSPVNLILNEKDTGLVKLWAANNQRLSEVKESEIDKNYGVVSQSYSLKVFPKYKQYGDDVPLFASYDPAFAPDKVVGVVNGLPADKTVVASAKFTCRLTGAGVHIVLPNHGRATKIRLFSLSGRLLIELQPDRFLSNGVYFIPRSVLNNHLTAKSTVVIRVEGKTGCWNSQMVLR